MGLLDRLFGRRTELNCPPAGEHIRVTIRSSFAGSPLVKVTGTTTYRKHEAQAMMRRHGQEAGGYLETNARLVREHIDSLGRDTVAVAVEGGPVGYLPMATAEQLLASGLSLDPAVPMQAFSELQGDALRVEAWVWLGSSEPEWGWSASSRPPMTKAARIAASHAEHVRVARQSPTNQAGRVRGVHYLELVEPIKEAKRQGRLEEALSMAEAGIHGAEKDRGSREPAPWYTEQAAIILRKMGRVDDEVRVLRRWLSFVPDDRRAETKLGRRLEKAEALRAK